MKNLPVAPQVRTVMHAAAERIRKQARETGHREVMSFLDTVDEAKRVFSERAAYIDACTQEAQRLGDSQRLSELGEMRDELRRDLQQFKFLAEPGLELLAEKADV